MTAVGVRSYLQNERLDRLLVNAVNNYSPSFAEESATQVFARYLEDSGISYERQPVAGGADTGGVSRANLVVGEEEYGDGAETLTEIVSAPLTVVGEPTGLAPCLEHFGYVECELAAEQLYSSHGYVVESDHQALAPVGAAFAELGRPFAPGSFRSHSDASQLFHKGTIPVVCGPGRLEVAHTPNEHVELEQLHQAAALYATIFHAACCECTASEIPTTT